MNPSTSSSAPTTAGLSRRGFLIGGSGAAALVWLNAPREAAQAQPAGAAAQAAERPHRTLLGVL